PARYPRAPLHHLRFVRRFEFFGGIDELAFPAGTMGLPPKGHALIRTERRQLPRIRDVAVSDQRLNLVRRIVFTQGVPFELGVEQNSPQIWVASEFDAEQVPALPL